MRPHWARFISLDSTGTFYTTQFDQYSMSEFPSSALQYSECSKAATGSASIGNNGACLQLKQLWDSISGDSDPQWSQCGFGSDPAIYLNADPDSDPVFVIKMKLLHFWFIFFKNAIFLNILPKCTQY